MMYFRSVSASLPSIWDRHLTRPREAELADAVGSCRHKIKGTVYIATQATGWAQRRSVQSVHLHFSISPVSDFYQAAAMAAFWRGGKPIYGQEQTVDMLRPEVGNRCPNG